MSPGAPTRSQRPLGSRVPPWNSYDAFALTADNPNPVVASV